VDKNLNRKCDKILGLTREIKSMLSIKPTDAEKKDDQIIGESWEETLLEAEQNFCIIRDALSKKYKCEDCANRYTGFCDSCITLHIAGSLPSNFCPKGIDNAVTMDRERRD
jgi:hypothetical protein